MVLEFKVILCFPSHAKGKKIDEELISVDGGEWENSA